MDVFVPAFAPRGGATQRRDLKTMSGILERCSPRMRRGGIALALALGLAFLLWRAPYGFCFNDESFCMTLAQRLWQGDALIVDEWHGTQNFGAVLLPVYALHRLIAGSNEGVLLFSRLVYCVLWWAVCAVVWHTIRSRRYPGGVFVFFYLILFSPLDCLTLSYTSVGLMCVLLLACLLLRLPARAPLGGGWLAAPFSALWVVLVLCCPTMAVAYLLLPVLALAGSRWERRQDQSRYFSNLLALYRPSLALVAAAAALYLFLFLFSRAAPTQALRSLPYLFQDPEHQGLSLFSALLALPLSLLQLNPWYLCVAVAVFLLGFMPAARRFRLPFFLLCAGAYLAAQTLYCLRQVYISFNHQMLYIVFLGAAALSLLEHRPRKLCFAFCLPSLLYSVLNSLVSNTGVMALAMALVPTGACGIVCILLLAEELRGQAALPAALRQLVCAAVCAVLLLQPASQLYTHLSRVYWDSSIRQLTAIIPAGCAQGLRTTPDQAATYETTLGELRQLLSGAEGGGRRFLSLTSAPWIYLDADLPFATFSAWSFGYGDGLADRIQDYQTVTPNAVPDLIFAASGEDLLPDLCAGYAEHTCGGAYLYTRR